MSEGGDVKRSLDEAIERITSLIEEQVQTKAQGLAGLRGEVRKHREEIVRLIDELIEELRKTIAEIEDTGN